MTRIITKFPTLAPSTWLALAATATLATTVVAGRSMLTIIRFDNARHERLARLGEIVGALQQEGIATVKAATRDLARQASTRSLEDSATYQRLAERMEGEVRVTGADMAFLLDSNGLVRMRAQQPGEPDILGSDLGFRRYFQRAKEGLEDEFAALGAFTRKRGIYASAPVRTQDGRFAGAAVFRFPATSIENRWLAQIPDPTALISPEGVVFAANEPTWRLKTLSLPDSALPRIESTRQYGENLQSLPLDALAESATWKGERHATLLIPLGAGWQILSLLPEQASRPLSRSQLGAASGIAAAWLFLVALGLVVISGLQKIRVAEMDKARLSKRLEEAERLESLGRLAGGVAHDFNNVLTAIIGYGSVLEFKLPAGSPEKDLAKRIGVSAQRASETVRQLMAFARRSGLQAKPISMHNLIRSLVEAMGNDIPSSVRVRLDLRARRDIVIADASHLQQAFHSLAKNSILAMPEGGELSLSTSIVETGNGKLLEFRSSDTGKGISPEILPHLFEPFFTTKQGGRGTGLGLASVWGTIQRHGGNISVESQTNKGTEFRIRLPLAPDGIEVDPPHPNGHGASAHKRLHILALDDSLQVREALVAMVVALGHKIEVFATFLELWNRMKDGSNVDLLILDLDMPGTNGVDALKRIRLTFPELPTMTASGHYSSAALQELKNLGVDTFLRKPFGTPEIGQAIDQTLARRI